MLGDCKKFGLVGTNGFDPNSILPNK